MGDEKIAVILGASGGIGSALARRLSAKGVQLVGAARHEEALKEVMAPLGGESVVADATNSDDVDRVFDEAREVFGRVDIAVNCVGSILLKPAHRLSDEEWRETLALNLDSSFFLLRAAAKAMRRDGGAIAFVSTAASRIGLMNHEAIAAAKGGVEALARSAAATYASRGIRVNVVAPGLVQTPLAEHLTSNDRARKASEKMHPLGRLGEADDVAALLDFLLSDEASWVTGQVIGADGGLADLKVPKP